MSEVLSAAARPVADRSDANGRGFRPDIQGLRALAVSMVVIYHLYPSLVPGGFAGVDVFFVISGFLITGHLWRGYQRDGRVRLLDFWGRRARRLVPAAALVLGVTWVVARLVLPPGRLADTAGQIRASALYFQDWQLAHEAVDYLTSNDAATPVQHFWSLSVEEQFYLVWPLLFVVAALAGRRHRRVVLAGLVVTLVAASLAYSVYETRVDRAAAYFLTTTRMWEFGVGGALAMLPERVDRVLRRQGWLGWAGLAVVLASAFALRGTSAFPGALALLPVSGAVMLIVGGSDLGRHGPARLMSARPMVFLGGISYSLYLWHWPMINLWTADRGKSPGALSGPALIVASLAAAWWTKVYVEDQVRLSPKLTGHGWRSLSTALAAALPVTLVSVYIASVPGQWDGKLGPGYPGAAALAGKAVSVPAKPVLPPPDDALAAIPEYWQQGCLDGEYAAAPKVCVYGDTTDPTLTVALVGDSVAGNWCPGTRRACPALSLEACHRPARYLPVDRHLDDRSEHQRPRRPVHIVPRVGRRGAARPAHQHPPRRRDHVRLRRDGVRGTPPGRLRGLRGHRGGDGTVLGATPRSWHLRGPDPGDPRDGLRSGGLRFRVRRRFAGL